MVKVKCRLIENGCPNEETAAVISSVVTSILKQKTIP